MRIARTLLQVLSSIATFSIVFSIPFYIWGVLKLSHFDQDTSFFLFDNISLPRYLALFAATNPDIIWLLLSLAICIATGIAYHRPGRLKGIQRWNLGLLLVAAIIVEMPGALLTDWLTAFTAYGLLPISYLFSAWVTDVRATRTSLLDPRIFSSLSAEDQSLVKAEISTLVPTYVLGIGLVLLLTVLVGSRGIGLPLEAIQYQDGRGQIGFVIATDDSQVLLLDTKSGLTTNVPIGDIKSRRICRTDDPALFPRVIDQFVSRPTLPDCTAFTAPIAGMSDRRAGDS